MPDNKSEILKIGVGITMAENLKGARVESSDEEGVSKYLETEDEQEDEQEDRGESLEKKGKTPEKESEKESSQPAQEVSIDSFMLGKHAFGDEQKKKAAVILSEMREKYGEIAIARKNHGEIFSTGLIRDTARSFFNEKELFLSRLCYEDLLKQAKADSSYRNLAVSYSEHLVLDEVHALLLSDISNEENYKKKYVCFSVDRFDGILRDSESILTPTIYLTRDIFASSDNEELSNIAKKMLGEISALKLYMEDVFLTFRF